MRTLHQAAFAPFAFAVVLGWSAHVRAEDAPKAIKGLKKMGEEALVLGRVVKGLREAVLV